MTQKEKFIDAFKSGKRFDIKNAEVIADEFAIGFADWLRVNYYDNGDFWIAWDNDKETKTSKELLEIYKKEKGL